MQNNDKDSKLLERLRLGHKDAFTQIYKTYHAKLFRYVVSLSKDVTIAEDLVQEQLMQLWVNRETQSITSLNAYLYRSIYNKYLNFYNTEKRQLTLKETLRIEAIIEIENEDEDIKAKRLNAIKKIINNLPEKRKEIFILSKLNNYEYKEIAKMRNISERTVESQIRKALITIRHEISLLRDAGTLIFLLYINIFFK
ncbi:RNA polymerase sigma-70 factor [uncultured Algibacter sp.]|uniref:RNA polymerase sigma factor n=1 Tax=uncultured Algibacter sp. TaxID=298659 RepID=UPI0032170E22